MSEPLTDQELDGIEKLNNQRYGRVAPRLIKRAVADIRALRNDNDKLRERAESAEVAGVTYPPGGMFDVTARLEAIKRLAQQRSAAGEQDITGHVDAIIGALTKPAEAAGVSDQMAIEIRILRSELATAQEILVQERELLLADNAKLRERAESAEAAGVTYPPDVLERLSAISGLAFNGVGDGTVADDVQLEIMEHVDAICRTMTTWKRLTGN